jgi:hypothetical protein
MDKLLRSICKAIGSGDGDIRWAMIKTGEKDITVVLDDPSDLDPAYDKLIKKKIYARRISDDRILCTQNIV